MRSLCVCLCSASVQAWISNDLFSCQMIFQLRVSVIQLNNRNQMFQTERAWSCRLNTVCTLPTVDWLLGTTQAFLYCSQHTKLLLCEVEELRALWALLFCSSLTQSETVSEPTVHGEPKQILSCSNFAFRQVFRRTIITAVSASALV